MRFSRAASLAMIMESVTQRVSSIGSIKFGKEPQKNCCIFQLNMSIYDWLTDLIHTMTSETAILIDFG